jgi:hypothetical protein
LAVINEDPMKFSKSIGARSLRALSWIGVAALAAVLAACGGGGSGGAASGDGSLRVALTDAPSCGYDHVWVSIEKVRVHQSTTASDADAGWSDLTLASPRRVDLLSLTNGVLEELGTMPLAAGSYSQVRLVLSTNGANGAATDANAVQPTGGAVTPLTTPSAQQSGLKLQAHFDVAAGQLSDIVLDFDACKSVVRAGNSGQFILKPVIAVVPRAVTAIQGFVATSLNLNSTTVSVQQNGTTVRATAPASSGQFTIPFLSTGTYTLVVVSDGRATAVVTGVPAGTGTTVINGTATAIAPPVSSMADVTGSLSLSSTPTVALTDATVQALQALTGGPTIEVANQPADSTLGTYRFHLPTGAPVKAPYASGGTLTFTADAPVAGKYTIQAQSPGKTTQTKPADISGGNATASFSFAP